jgi:serine/threonine-protein kinase
MGTGEEGSDRRIAGKYRIERELGKGGMGLVVAATHVDLGQRVAIKLLHASAAYDTEALARFTREARAAARIQGEHVVRVMDVGSLEDGTAYIVMEYLEGDNLEAVLQQRGPLPIPVAVGWLLEACEGVAAAHAAGIVHRDLKPANLFLAKQPDRRTLIKVLDFGVSKIMRPPDASALDEAVVTQTGQVFGSPNYMSPEQLRSAGRVDVRADIWALGAVLQEMLTGRPPFLRGSMAEVLAAIMRDPPPPLRGVRPDAPPELERVLLRCLSKAPEERFADVRELGRALAPFGAKGAEESVERIARLLSAGDVTADISAQLPPPAAAPAAQASQTPMATSLGASGDGTFGVKRRARGRLFVAIAALLIAAVVVTVRQTMLAPETVASATHPVLPELPGPVPAPSASHADQAFAPASLPGASTANLTPASPGTSAAPASHAHAAPERKRVPKDLEPF